MRLQYEFTMARCISLPDTTESEPIDPAPTAPSQAQKEKEKTQVSVGEAVDWETYGTGPV